MQLIKPVVKHLGVLLLLICFAMMLSALHSCYELLDSETSVQDGLNVLLAFLYSIGVGSFLGTVFIIIGQKSRSELDRREALLLVSLAWFIGSALSALPYWFWAMNHSLGDQDPAFLSYASCYFEAMSGLTTTGATVLSHIETIPNSLLFWRGITHWLGGLGIVVIFVAVLPLLGAGGEARRLYGAEASGIGHDDVSVNIKESARMLLSIYTLFTLTEIIVLRIVDPSISWFSATVHSFATIATGGFSTMNESAGGLSSQAQWVVIIFMVLAGVNFANYQSILQGRFRRVFRDSELKFYLIIIATASALIALSIYNTTYHTTQGNVEPTTIEGAIRDSLFQVSSIQTTTGFATVNFEEWSLFAKSILVALMFVGGCGGSTGGGIKVVRILGALKIIRVEIERAFRPSVVRPIRLIKGNLDYNQRISILAYFIAIIFFTGLGAVLLMLTEDPNFIDGTTALTASIATINNVGPGLAEVGAIKNYLPFSDLGKIIMSVLMAAGRLEFFAVIVVFMPQFWKSH